MVVVITSTGGVTKRVLTFDQPVDPRPRRLGGRVPQRAPRGLRPRRADAPAAAAPTARSAPSERRFLDALAPVFGELAGDGRRHALRRGRRAAARRRAASQDLTQLNELLTALERRVALLARAAHRARRARRARAHRRRERAAGAAVVRARRRRLRAAGAQARDRVRVGPLRMDYARTIATVREAARAALARTSRTSTRLMAVSMASTVPRDPYEVLGVPRDADEQQIKKSFRRLARELHPDVNAHDPRGRGEVQGGRGGLRDPVRRRAPRDLRPLRPRGPAQRRHAAELRGLRLDQRPLRGVLRPGVRLGGFAGRASGPAAGRGRDRRRRDRPRAGGRRAPRVEIAFDGVDRCERCYGDGAEPGTTIATCERCGGAGVLQMVSRSPFGQVMRTAACDACARRRPDRPSSPCTDCDGRGRVVRARTLRVDVPAGIADGQRIRLAGSGHAGERGGPPGDLYVQVRVRPRRAAAARRRRPRDRARRARAARRARHDGSTLPRSAARPR